MALGDRIKEKREARGMTLRELADKIGVTEATVSRYESNQIRNPTNYRLMQIANALNVDVNYLMAWDSNETYNDKPAFDKSAFNVGDTEFGLMVGRRKGNGKNPEIVKLMFRGSQPILSINGTELEFSLTYMDLQPEDKIAVCKAMLERAKDELLRGA